MQQETQLPIASQGKNFIKIIIIILIVVAVLAIAGVVLAWQTGFSIDKKIADLATAIGQQNQSLGDRLERLESGLNADTPENLIENNNQDNNQERILLTNNNIGQYNKGTSQDCDEDFNQSPYNKWANYQNKERGISLNIPYNDQWGNDQYRLNPYEQINNSLIFGPIRGGEACSWTRVYKLEFLPVKSASEVIGSLLGTEKFITQKTFSGLTAVEYESSGLLQYANLEIIGQKFNYRLTMDCGSQCQAQFSLLEAMAASAKLE